MHRSQLGGAALSGKLPRLTLNKGSQQMRLPQKRAMQQLIRGNPTQQSLGNYSKLTPTGATAAAMNYGDEVYQGMQQGSPPQTDDS